MNVSLFYDDPGYIGGAELTMREIAAGAPDEVALTSIEDADTVIVGNCFTTQPLPDLKGKRVIRYIHDTRGPGPIDSDERIFFSPIQRERAHLDGELCPAPVDLRPLRSRKHKRRGTCTIGTFGHWGKGQRLLTEWSDANETVDIYGSGPLIPAGPNLTYKGDIPYEQVPTTLWRYKRFIHLPSEVESYGRGVVEAWAAGCSLIVNHNVGSLYWIEKEPEVLDDPAGRFWSLVLR